MSEPLRETAPSGEREHSVETPCRQPAPVRTYYDQVRSLLGKREHETSQTEAQPPARSSHHMISDIDNSVTTGDTSDFAQYIENGESSIYMLDGTTDKINKRWGNPIAAIFIHAGAGYHSIANQEHHLKACSEAARVGMKVLKAGRSATEAVEAALKVLENKEITNAGYGSNLAIDGTVECDATVVDHFGRSGACGAVSNVKNPITLARVILESSNKPLSLRRVPPNLLVGEGARDFARDAGVELVANDDLISRNARDRFIRWRDDLRRAEGYGVLMLPSNRNETTSQSEQDARKEHTNAILTGVWNEGQPDSPASGSPCTALQNLQSPISSPATTIMTPQVLPKPTPDRSPLSFLNSSLSLKRQRLLPAHSDEYVDNYAGDSSPTPGLSVDRMPNPIGSYIAPHDGASDVRDAVVFELPTPITSQRRLPQKAPESERNSTKDQDRITDTVGAIAIDQAGRIAAGSSSGGIGMKHRGRVGPAALVGVGTAVIPADENDADSISVAAVTSGTGEHMATTMASQRCAERIYQGSLRGAGGRDVLSDDENAILASFIANDFLGHPGVRESASPGAIGAMAVKKAPGGYYLYFAHNTESFALASMASNDIVPWCVMSRINEGGSGLAQGARKIRT